MRKLIICFCLLTTFTILFFSCNKDYPAGNYTGPGTLSTQERGNNHSQNGDIDTIPHIDTIPNPDTLPGQAYTFRYEDLVAYYPFEGNAQDISGHAFHGVPHNVDIAAGRNPLSERSYYFDGYTSYIRLPNQVALNSDNDFSIEAWIQSYGITYDYRYFDDAIYGQTDGYYGSDYPIILFAVKEDYTIRGALRGYSNPPLNSISTDTMEQFTWNHVVMVRSARMSSISMYLNGVLVAYETSHSIIGNTLSNDHVAIGAYIDDLESMLHYFHGNIDLVRIWNIALMDGQVRALYKDNFIFQ